MSIELRAVTSDDSHACTLVAALRIEVDARHAFAGDPDTEQRNLLAEA